MRCRKRRWPIAIVRWHPNTVRQSNNTAYIQSVCSVTGVPAGCACWVLTRHWLTIAVSRKAKSVGGRPSLWQDRLRQRMQTNLLVGPLRFTNVGICTRAVQQTQIVAIGIQLLAPAVISNGCASACHRVFTSTNAWKKRLICHTYNTHYQLQDCSHG
jgi:hypothetical protein